MVCLNRGPVAAIDIAADGAAGDVYGVFRGGFVGLRSVDIFGIIGIPADIHRVVFRRKAAAAHDAAGCAMGEVHHIVAGVLGALAAVDIALHRAACYIDGVVVSSAVFAVAAIDAAAHMGIAGHIDFVLRGCALSAFPAHNIAPDIGIAEGGSVMSGRAPVAGGPCDGAIYCAARDFGGIALCRAILACCPCDRAVHGAVRDLGCVVSGRIAPCGRSPQYAAGGGIAADRSCLAYGGFAGGCAATGGIAAAGTATAGIAASAAGFYGIDEIPIGGERSLALALEGGAYGVLRARDGAHAIAEVLHEGHLLVGVEGLDIVEIDFRGVHRRPCEGDIRRTGYQRTFILPRNAAEGELVRLVGCYGIVDIVDRLLNTARKMGVYGHTGDRSVAV